MLEPPHTTGSKPPATPLSPHQLRSVKSKTEIGHALQAVKFHFSQPSAVTQSILERLPETMSDFSQNTHQRQDVRQPLRFSKPPTPRLALSAEEVAEVLGISRAHVWRLHSSGRIPRPVRLGRTVRWDRKTLESWLEAGGPTRDRWEAMRPVPNN